jgi:hypothetical protein
MHALRRSVIAACAAMVITAGVVAATNPSQGETAVGAGAHARVIAGPGSSAARVVVVAWPNGKTLERLKNGAKVPLVNVGSAASNSAGVFDVRMNFSSLGRRFKQADGSVHVEVDVSTSKKSAAWNGTIPQHQIAGRVSSVLLPAYAFDLDRGTVTGPGVSPSSARLAVFNDPDIAARVASSARRSTGPLPPSPSPSGTEDPCNLVARKRLLDRQEHFLNVYTWSGVKAVVTETHGSQHSVGVGISRTGTSWSASGSVTKTWSDSNTVTAPFRNNRAVGNAINYRKFQLVCQKQNNGWRVVPTDLDALMPATFTRQSILTPTFRHCQPYRKGQTYTLDHQNNTTYAGGVTLGFVNLSAHAAMTRQTSETFYASKNTFICGNNNSSLNKSTQVAALKTHP